MKYLQILQAENKYGYNDFVRSEYQKYVQEMQKAFEDIKKFLSKRFLYLYEKNSRFHDWLFEECAYQIKPGKNKDRIVIHVSNGRKKYLLIFSRVSNLYLSSSNDERMWFGDTYRYDEWETAENGRIKYSMITAFSTVISFEFSTVTICSQKISRRLER